MQYSGPAFFQQSISVALLLFRDHHLPLCAVAPLPDDIALPLVVLSPGLLLIPCVQSPLTPQPLQLLLVALVDHALRGVSQFPLVYEFDRLPYSYRYTTLPRRCSWILSVQVSGRIGQRRIANEQLLPKFGPAFASYMTAAACQFNHRMALETSPPTLHLSFLERGLEAIVLRALLSILVR